MIAIIVGAFLAFEAEPIGEPPTKFTVEGVSAERTIAEFMSVCLRPRWISTEIKKAVQSSDFKYKEEGRVASYAFLWKSKYAVLNVNHGDHSSQCALSIGSIQPRTGEQLVAMLKPAVEAEIGHAVTEDHQKFRLEWVDPKSRHTERIELANATSEPAQVIWFVLDSKSPEIENSGDTLPTPNPASE